MRVDHLAAVLLHFLWFWSGYWSGPLGDARGYGDALVDKRDAWCQIPPGADEGSRKGSLVSWAGCRPG